MTRYVRFEEIDGDLIVRVPADVARRLGFVAGDEAVLTDSENGLNLEPLDERRRKQLDLIKQIINEEDAVLTALAK